jgi:hypothetical protein
MYNGSNIVIRNNWIHDNLKQGILGNAKNSLIDRNTINHNGDFALCAQNYRSCNLMHGIYVTGPSWSITNNLIYDNLANGIVMAGYGFCPDGSCYSGGPGNSKFYTDASYAGADKWLIANNTIAYQQYRDGIVLWLAGATNSKIINNIFYENSQKFSGGPNGISFFSSPGGGHQISNNLCYATAPGATACIAANGAGKYTGSGNIVNTLNPKFVNASATIPAMPNFMLTSSSPAINAGANLFKSGVTTDFGGTARPQSGPFEIGAYEHGGSPPPTVSRPSEPSSFNVR